MDKTNKMLKKLTEAGYKFSSSGYIEATEQGKVFLLDKEQVDVAYIEQVLFSSGIKKRYIRDYISTVQSGLYWLSKHMTKDTTSEDYTLDPAIKKFLDKVKNTEGNSNRIETFIEIYINDIKGRAITTQSKHRTPITTPKRTGKPLYKLVTLQKKYWTRQVKKYITLPEGSPIYHLADNPAAASIRTWTKSGCIDARHAEWAEINPSTLEISKHKTHYNYIRFGGIVVVKLNNILKKHPKLTQRLAEYNRAGKDSLLAMIENYLVGQITETFYPSNNIRLNRAHDVQAIHREIYYGHSKQKDLTFFEPSFLTLDGYLETRVKTLDKLLSQYSEQDFETVFNTSNSNYDWEQLILGYAKHKASLVGGVSSSKRKTVDRAREAIKQAEEMGIMIFGIKDISKTPQRRKPFLYQYRDIINKQYKFYKQAKTEEERNAQRQMTLMWLRNTTVDDGVIFLSEK